MRLIDADKLKQNVLDWEDCYNGFSDAYEKARIIDEIDAQPTIDAEPTRHGKWKEYQRLEANIVGELQSAECSVCGRYHTTPYMHSYDYYEYCPWCGAKMDEGEL